MSRDRAQLERAVAAGDLEQAHRVVEAATRRAWADEIRTVDGDDLLDTLRRYRLFEWMLPLADALSTVDPTRHTAIRQGCQALVELGALSAAESTLKAALATGPGPIERGEALGLLGRIAKQRFVSGRSVTDLAQAVDHYRAGWEGGTDRPWHGVNLLALLEASRRFDRGVPGQPGDERLADDVLDLAKNGEGSWAVATEVEAALALDRADEAAAALHRLVESDAPLFHLQALRRQLWEIWELDEADPLLLTIDEHLIGPGELVLPGGDGEDHGSSVERFEKIFGTAKALTFSNLEDGLVAAQSVGKVTDRSGRGIGTAFLVPGCVIAADLGDDLILVTNAHVISREFNGGIPVEDAQVRFEVTRDMGGAPLICDGLEEIWSSPFERCDVTLLRFSSGEPKLERRIQPADGLPAVVDGAYVTVVGHPAAGLLSISIRGNDLLEYDEDRDRMHYVTPTEPGSSGSPVFDHQWRLIGVHHAGHHRMPRLSGAGFHAANEAATLDFIRREYAATS